MSLARFVIGLAIASILSAFVRGESIQVELESVHDVLNIRTGTKSVVATLRLSGPDAVHVVAARAIIAQATDDTGRVLQQEGAPSFYTTSVGSTQGDHSEIMAQDPISFTLSPAATDASELQSVEGRLEVFLPERDPDTLVVVDPLPPKFGLPIESRGLKAARITLVVYDKASTEKFRSQDAAWAPQDFDAGPWFIAWPRPESLFPGIPPAAQASMMRMMGARAQEMPTTAIGVGALDPNGRLLPVEFQDRAGAPLRYNHHGAYHSSSGQKDGKRFDGYDLKTQFPVDGKMVCWVMTDKSLESVPFKLEHVPLPVK